MKTTSKASENHTHQVAGKASGTGGIAHTHTFDDSTYALKADMTAADAALDARIKALEQAGTTPPPVQPPPTAQYTFQAEFNSASDLSLFHPTYQAGDPGYGGNSDFLGSMAQVSIVNGAMRITAERKATPSGRPYASASVSTNYSQRYGTWEARVKYPKGQGVFPAFWNIQPGPPVTPPEIDIFEAYPSNGPGGSGLNYLSSGLNTSLGAYPAGGADAPPLYYDTRGDLTLDWHVHKMIWKPGSLQLLIDGIDRGTYTNVAKLNTIPAMVTVFTFAMGVSGVYEIDASTPSPLFMDIDYLRISA